jgi:nucleoside-diphosphate-sugar epimerase
MTTDAQSALIGYTGFVGGNLRRQRQFDAMFNSSNIGEMAGRGFDLVVCAGAPAEKWKANAEPERDVENIERLIQALEHANIGRLVLVSTVDVFINPVNVDEDSPTPMTGLHAYGRNRRLLEQIVSSRFDSLVVRLPGLYGPGLKKNVIYDLLNDNEVHKIDSRGVFQFYNVDRLWSDIDLAMSHDLRLVHLATEPVSVADVAQAAFGTSFTNEGATVPARYDVQTKHAPLFGGGGRYVESRVQELSGITEFVARERQSRA